MLVTDNGGTISWLGWFTAFLAAKNWHSDKFFWFCLFMLMFILMYNTENTVNMWIGIFLDLMCFSAYYWYIKWESCVLTVKLSIKFKIIIRNESLNFGFIKLRSIIRLNSEKLNFFLWIIFVTKIDYSIQ